MDVVASQGYVGMPLAVRAAEVGLTSSACRGHRSCELIHGVPGHLEGKAADLG